MINVTLTGRLVADPELTTYGADNTPTARLRVASNQPGVDHTDSLDVAVFGDQAIDTLTAARNRDRMRLKGTGRQYVWRTGISLAARSVKHTPRRHTAEMAAAEHTRTSSASAAR